MRRSHGASGTAGPVTERGDERQENALLVGALALGMVLGGFLGVFGMLLGCVVALAAVVVLNIEGRRQSRELDDREGSRD